MLNDASPPAARSPNGVLFVATGDRYIDEAVGSARSVKKFHPELPICIASDRDMDTSDSPFDQSLKIEDAHYGFIDKIAVLKKSPFDRTLFLDSDTVVLHSILGVFELLNRFDIAASHEPARFLYSIGSVPDDFPELNTGVLAFRSGEKFNEFIDSWLSKYRAEIAENRKRDRPQWHDQLSFTQAIWESSLALNILPPEWNYRAPFPQFLCGKVRIFHGRLSLKKANLEFVNASQGGRLMNPNPRRMPSIFWNTFKLFRCLDRT